MTNIINKSHLKVLECPCWSQIAASSTQWDNTMSMVSTLLPAVVIDVPLCLLLVSRWKTCTPRLARERTGERSGATCMTRVGNGPSLTPPPLQLLILIRPLQLLFALGLPGSCRIPAFILSLFFCCWVLQQKLKNVITSLSGACSLVVTYVDTQAESRRRM